MNDFSKVRYHLVRGFKENPLLSTLILLLIVLAIFFVVVMCFEPDWISKSLGIEKQQTTKYQTLKFLGLCMGGILIALQALMSYKRAKAMEDTAKAQADAANAQADAAKAQARATEEQTKANLHTEQGLRQERLKNAIEHLGNGSDSVRLGGAYELFHLAEDNKELRQTVLDILCAHIRHTTGEEEYRKVRKSKPSEEVQSLLTLLFVHGHEIFKGLDINLQGSHLKRANLEKAHLEKADLEGAHLQGAELQRAHLQGANLEGAHLQGAELQRAHLRGAHLQDTHLQGANLFQVYLQGAELQRAHLRGVHLQDAYLQGANLEGAHLQGANLEGAHLQGAVLQRAHLQGTNLQDARLQESNLQGAHLQGIGRQVFGTFAQHVRKLIGTDSVLSGITFEGGLSEEEVDSLTVGLLDEKADVLRQKLRSHVGQRASNQLPQGSGAITNPPYTKEEAEEWIAEYEKAMSEVPEGDS